MSTLHGTGQAEGNKKDQPVNQQNVAAMLPQHLIKWGDTSAVVTSLWSTKWTSSGLMPVRPVVVWTSDATLSARHAFEL